MGRGASPVACVCVPLPAGGFASSHGCQRSALLGFFFGGGGNGLFFRGQRSLGVSAFFGDRRRDRLLVFFGRGRDHLLGFSGRWRSDCWVSSARGGTDCCVSSAGGTGSLTGWVVVPCDSSPAGCWGVSAVSDVPAVSPSVPSAWALPAKTSAPNSASIVKARHSSSRVTVPSVELQASRVGGEAGHQPVARRAPRGRVNGIGSTARAAATLCSPWLLVASQLASASASASSLRAARATWPDREVRPSAVLRQQTRQAHHQARAYQHFVHHQISLQDTVMESPYRSAQAGMAGRRCARGPIGRCPAPHVASARPANAGWVSQRG